MLAEFFRIVRFGFVGLLASGVHLMVASLLLWSLAHIHEFLVNFLAYCAAFGVSWWGHQRVTFRQGADLRRFLLMSWSGLTVNYAVLWLVLQLGFSGMQAIVPAVLFSAACSYLLARIWVFKVV